MKKKRADPGKVNAYSYSRLAGDYLKIFTAPARLLILLIIIGLLFIFGIIFFKTVIF